jgi:hypothetical protein
MQSLWSLWRSRLLIAEAPNSEVMQLRNGAVDGGIDSHEARFDRGKPWMIRS